MGVMIMRLRAITLLTIILCVTSIACAAPLLPGEFYGTVYIDGSPAPAGTNITAVIDGQIAGFTITSDPGVFGGVGPFDARLPVVGSADGQEISFAINGNPASETAVFHPGTTGQVGLSFGAAPAVSPTPGIAAVPTEKPVVDNENDPYSRGPTGSSALSAASPAPAATMQAPAVPSPAAAAPAGTASAAARQPPAVEGATPPAAAGSAAEPDTTGSLPVYAVAGLVVLAVVGFAGYSIYRRWTRWQ
jgi:hypothetical protein